MIRVAIVEDHPIFREGLAQSIRGAVDMTCVTSTDKVKNIVEGEVPVDVVVLDLHLPGLTGPPAVLHLVERRIRVLVLSGDSTRDVVLEALAAGASGYVTKQAEPADILAAIRFVAEDGTYVSPTLAGLLLQATREPPSSRLDLTEREKEVLRLVAAGERDQDIASELIISVATVRSHLDRIRDKTGRRRRPDLTRLAFELSLDDNNKGLPA